MLPKERKQKYFFLPICKCVYTASSVCAEFFAFYLPFAFLFQLQHNGFSNLQCSLQRQERCKRENKERVALLTLQFQYTLRHSERVFFLISFLYLQYSTLYFARSELFCCFIILVSATCHSINQSLIGICKVLRRAVHET